ncbi:hypothetical protein KAFR_0D04900 [Kazachstania africana CBS 2517]|uniref:Pal1 cell morphology protein n=1 Tax=Kazachstania africana (strain ATCC 22294 / BCRC 22015 / CBS 2517 / CECT 1963 / NBRC 1671 / NRRL Y-8276) TaxID=1071382 RepID=H2AUT7_KAZAF|nr:hypothetical protein KAFR_0D04900 [Kazachstania africana CBS 2517]CCF58137.1 hypothetical protein KAFR_0D04900 [Kazachstania africana CBS 2517]
MNSEFSSTNPFRTSPEQPSDHRASRSNNDGHRARDNNNNPFLDDTELPKYKETQNTKKYSTSNEKQMRPPSYDESTSNSRRQHRHKHHSHKHHHTKTKNGVGVDTIDKLDLTGVFGGSFHHDGPFDAVTPRRNAKDDKRAPVKAFPIDSANNTVGGVTMKKSALDEVFGYEKENEDTYYIKPGKNIGSSRFDPKAKVELVHGPTTAGLGSTTFLDGAPASENAIREENMKNQLNRKKSFKLSRKSFDNNQNYTYFSDPNANNTGKDDEFLELKKKPSRGNTFIRRVKSLKVGRRS